jgi:hypothetical protein
VANTSLAAAHVRGIASPPVEAGELERDGAVRRKRGMERDFGNQYDETTCGSMLKVLIELCVAVIRLTDSLVRLLVRQTG